MNSTDAVAFWDGGPASGPPSSWTRQPFCARPRTRCVRAGRLLVVDHGSAAPWSWNQEPGVRYPSPREVAAGIGLPPRTWTVQRADAPRRPGPEATTGR